MGEVRYQLVWVLLLVAWLMFLVLTVDMTGAVKNIWDHWAFGLQAMINFLLCVSGPCTFQISCGKWYKITQDHSVWHGCCSSCITLLTLYTTFLFGFHAHPPFYSHDWWIHGNNWRMILLDVVITTLGLDWLYYILQLLLKTTPVQGYATNTLNIGWRNYQYLLVFIQVSIATLFIDV